MSEENTAMITEVRVIDVMEGQRIEVSKGASGNQSALSDVDSLAISSDAPAAASGQVNPEWLENLQQHGAILPRYRAAVLYRIFEESNALRPCVDSYVSNIDGHGHRFDPLFDVQSGEINQEIAQAMVLEKIADGDPAYFRDNLQVDPPTPEEVEAKKAEVFERIRVEQWRLTNFFNSTVDRRSFTSLRKQIRQDLEVTGNAYLEILRDPAGRIRQFEYAPVHTMFPCALDREPTLIDVRVRTSPLSFTEVPRWRRHRKFLQDHSGQLRYFKDFGDKRILSRYTGRYYDKLADFKEAEPNGVIATEIVHFKIGTPIDSYGVPRWIGCLIEALGSRKSSELNIMYFDNKSIPPMAILVSGGRLTEGAVERLRSTIQDKIKGQNNFFNVLILDAEGTDSKGDTSRLKIEIVPLAHTLEKDALFREYDKDNREKIGQAFRLPRLLRGDVSDINRATADASLLFAEGQVFEPLRGDFNDWVNLELFPELGVWFHAFVSASPVQRDPQALTDMVQKLMAAAALVPADGREIAQEILNKRLPRITAPWVFQPVQLTQTGVIPVPPETDALAGPDNAAPSPPAPLQVPGDPAQVQHAAPPGTPAPAPEPAQPDPQAAAQDVAKAVLALREDVRRQLGDVWFKKVSTAA